jgi:hypothetical protein
MGTISKESAKRRNKETSSQKKRRTRITNIASKRNLRKDELNVMK